MPRLALVLGALAALATAARADVKASDCAPLEGVGCWFAPEGVPAGAPLLIYLRGHHPSFKAAVPPEQSLASARQAFAAYALGGTARDKQVVVLVTYRSGLGVTDADVAALAKKAKRTFSSVILAAHSGGYVGLGRTLDSGLRPSRVVMLDDFYGAGGDGLSQKLQRLITAGAGCSGFYTPHNKKNYEDGYKRTIQCSIDAMDGDDQHNSAVSRCLGGYLDGRSCAPR
jgi:hypothetical protein